MLKRLFEDLGPTTIDNSDLDREPVVSRSEEYTLAALTIRQRSWIAKIIGISTLLLFEGGYLYGLGEGVLGPFFPQYNPLITGALITIAMILFILAIPTYQTRAPLLFVAAICGALCFMTQYFGNTDPGPHHAGISTVVSQDTVPFHAGGMWSGGICTDGYYSKCPEDAPKRLNDS